MRAGLLQHLGVRPATARRRPGRAGGQPGRLPARFSPDIDVFERFKFGGEIATLAEENRLLLVVRQFCEVDLHPDRVPNAATGDLFEELIRKFAEAPDEEAGEHFTPRDAIRLVVDLLFAEDAEALATGSVLRGVYDPTAGTGGVLSVSEEHLQPMNPAARLSLYGQEINDQSYAICKSDLIAKGQKVTNIQLGDTLREDMFADRTFDYCLSDPPYGVDWRSAQESVVAERAAAPHGRFGAGLPKIGDGQMLFLTHLASKMRPVADGGCRAGIVLNGSPLFNGAAGSGESEIRRWLLESDLVDAIVALPTNMFYGTGISTYVWVLDNTKPAERVGRVQLVDGTSFFTEMRKNLGDNAQEIAPTAGGRRRRGARWRWRGRPRPARAHLRRLRPPTRRRPGRAAGAVARLHDEAGDRGGVHPRRPARVPALRDRLPGGPAGDRRHVHHRGRRRPRRRVRRHQGRRPVGEAAPDEHREGGRDYTDAHLETRTDPNLVHDIATELDEAAVYTEADLDALAAVVLAGGTSSALTAAVAPAKQRYVSRRTSALTAHGGQGDRQALDALDVIRRDVGTFVRVYDFLRQVVDYGDAGLEKRAMFLRCLAPLIRDDSWSADVDLGDVALVHVKQVDKGSHDLTLGERTGLQGMTAAGSAAAQDPRMVALAEVIERLDALFGDEEFTDAQKQSFVESSITALLENDTLRTQAEVNTATQFAESPDLEEELVGTITENQGTHSTMVDLLYSQSPQVEVLVGAIATALHAAVRAEGPARR